MAKAKVNKLGEVAIENLTRDMASIRTAIDNGSIEFKNAKGEVRTLPYSRVDHTGKFVGDRQTDKEAWDAYVALCFRAQHEQKKSINNGAALAVKAGHSMKMSTASCIFRTSKMESTKAPVCVQLAQAQKFARSMRDLQAEIDRRAEIEKARAEEAAKLAEQAKVAEALMGATAKAA